MRGTARGTSPFHSMRRCPTGCALLTCPSTGVAFTVALTPWGTALRSLVRQATTVSELPSSTAMYRLYLSRSMNRRSLLGRGETSSGRRARSTTPVRVTLLNPSAAPARATQSPMTIGTNDSAVRPVAISAINQSCSGKRSYSERSASPRAISLNHRWACRPMKHVRSPTPIAITGDIPYPIRAGYLTRTSRAWSPTALHARR